MASTTTVKGTSTKKTFRTIAKPKNLSQDKINELIRRRAYEIYQHRGNNGDANTDWLTAEDQILRELGLK